MKSQSVMYDTDSVLINISTSIHILFIKNIFASNVILKF